MRMVYMNGRTAILTRARVCDIGTARPVVGHHALRVRFPSGDGADGRSARDLYRRLASERQPSSGSIGAVIRPRIEGNRRTWGGLTNDVDETFE
jgi:hypothetical protein